MLTEIADLKLESLRSSGACPHSLPRRAIRHWDVCHCSETDRRAAQQPQPGRPSGAHQSVCLKDLHCCCCCSCSAAVALADQAEAAPGPGLGWD